MQRPGGGGSSTSDGGKAVQERCRPDETEIRWAVPMARARRRWGRGEVVGDGAGVRARGGRRRWGELDSMIGRIPITEGDEYMLLL